VHIADQNQVHLFVVYYHCRLRCSKDGRIDYSHGLGIDTVNYEQGKITMSIINPWSLQLCKKEAEKMHRHLIGDENASVSQSKFI
jgi:hypothetical protein